MNKAMASSMSITRNTARSSSTGITRHSAGCPINNQALSYIFQGLSDDGRYFIHATFPIKTAFLVETSENPSEAEADPVRGFIELSRHHRLMPRSTVKKWMESILTVARTLVRAARGYDARAD